MDTKEKKEHNESREIREIFAQTLSQETQEKRQRACSEKSNTKNFSRFFSPELSRVLSSVAFGRYESYLINLFLLQEESFHDERRREKGKFRLYYISSRRRRIVFLVFVGEF